MSTRTRKVVRLQYESDPAIVRQSYDTMRRVLPKDLET